MRQGARSQLFAAETITGVTIALLTREHLVRVLRQLPVPKLVELLGALNSMWAESLADWARMVGMSLRQRLTYVLGNLGDRFGSRESRGLLLPLELGQQELAEMIGGSRPMVGKLLQDMERDGVIIRQGRQFIVVPSIGPTDATKLVDAPAMRRAMPPHNLDLRVP